MNARRLALFATAVLLLAGSTSAVELWFGSSSDATGGWVGYYTSNNRSGGQGFYNLTGAPTPGSLMIIHSAGVRIRSVGAPTISNLSFAVYAANPADPQKWVLPALATGYINGGSVGVGWNNFTMNTVGSISPTDGHYFFTLFEGGALNGAVEYAMTNAGGGGDRVAKANATWFYNTAYNISCFLNYSWYAGITINAPPSGFAATGSSAYNFSPVDNSTCAYWLNGSYTHVGSVDAGEYATGYLPTGGTPGDYNFTVICKEDASGVNNTLTHEFTLHSNYSFRAYDNVTSTQLANFTVTFANATNTTAYTASGEWLNKTRFALPQGDVNITFDADGYAPSTIQTNINTSEVIYLNQPVSPAGFNVEAYDEETEDRIYFTLTISNATGASVSYDTVYNATGYYLNSSFPTGACTLDVTTANSSHYARRYYATITNETFYDLNAYLLNQSSDVILVRFHIRNKFGDPVEEASMNILKNIGGAEVTVAQGKSDAAGDITAYLLLNELYSLQVTHPDYANYYTSLYPSTNDYTISLGDASEDAYLPYNIYNDVSWLLIPYSNAITSEMTNITLFVTSANSSLYAWGMNVSWNGTSLYEVNVTGSPSGGVVYYNLNWTNATNYSTMGNISVQGWFKVNPPGGFSRDLQYISLGDADISLVSVQENLLVSGLSTLSFAIIWCLLALLGGAWVGRRSSIGGLVFMLAIMGIAAYGGWLDINTGSAVGGWFGVEDYTISGWYIFTFSALLALSVIYLKERWV